jgi:hypothetical protein
VTPFAIGSTVLNRETWGERTWLTYPTTVAADEGPDGVLALVLSDGAAFAFDDAEPVHPWSPRPAWRGPTVLQLRRPGLWYAVWKFFGPRDQGSPFLNWYVNFERPVVREPDGVRTDDLELDLVVHPDGRREWKDVEHLHARLAERRFATSDLEHVLAAAADVLAILDADAAGDPTARWWSRWDDWVPDAPAGSP